MPDAQSLFGDKKFLTLARAGLAVLIIYVAVLAFAELKSIRFIGSGVSATNTITVSGKGEVSAVPDTANFSVTVQEEAKDVATAQAEATRKSNDIISFLRSSGVEEKDIQTSDYSIYPKYDYQQIVCVAYPCPPGKQTLTGYQVSQTITVKVRDTSKAGDLLSGVGSRGASSVGGLSFELNKTDQATKEAEARGKAIDDARVKAEELAKQLGVSLVRIVGFSENGNYPIYYAKAEMTMAADGRGGAAPAPQIPTGENKITSNVTVTYEIR